MFDEKDIERFFSRSVEDKKTGCWEWQGHRNKSGYGQIKIKRKTYVAHRASYMIHNGCIRENMFICHSCDNPGCVNPEHLFIGTPADNSKDMVLKGRSAKPKGVENNNAVLTNHDVNAIRRLLLDGKKTAVEIASIFNVSDGAIRLIDTGKAWTHVKMSDGSEFRKRKPRETKFLSKDEVVEIKNILAINKTLTFPEIAREYGVDRMTINRIATGDTWSEIVVDLPNGEKYSYEKKSYRRTKISEPDVKEIKVLLQSGAFSYSEISKRFKISRSNIGQIALGRIWADVFIVLQDGTKWRHK